MNIDMRNIEVLEDEMVEVLKAKTPQERLKMAFDMWKMVRRQLECYLETTHKEWSKEKIQKEVARRMSHGSV